MRNTLKIALFSIYSILNFGCQKEMDLVFTSPDFNAPIIGSINPIGVEFICEVNSFGTLPIEEHGFMYGSTTDPRPENAEIIKLEGRPNKKIILKATHTLQPQKTYYVVAYFKTSEGYVFSPQVSFTSQGSSGFFHEKVELPNPLYFGDTIEIIGSGFSRIKENYKLKINQTLEVDVISPTEKGFKFILPEEFSLFYDSFLSPTFKLDIGVYGKNTQLDIPYMFRKPEFKVDQKEIYNFNDEITIKGKYFTSLITSIRFTEAPELYNPSVILNDSTIVFQAVSNIPSPNPTLLVKIREEEYLIENIFTLNPSEFDPNQVYRINSNSTLSITGQNFNAIHDNYLYIDEKHPISSHFYLNYATENRFDLTSFSFQDIFLEDGEILDRNFEISIKSLGDFSKNKVKIEVIDPFFPYQKLPKSLLDRYSFEYFEQSFTANVENQIYLFLKNEIIKINHFEKSFSFVGSVPIGSQNILGGLFYLNTDDGKIIIGSQNKENTSNSHFIHLFDPQTNNVQRLTDIPDFSRSDFVKGSFYENGSIMLEIGKNKDGQVINEKWKLNLNQNTWSFEGPTEFKNGYISFKYNKEIYSFDDQNGSGIALNRLNPNTRNWEPITENLGNLGFPYGSKVILIQNKAYFLTRFNYMIELDMTNKATNIINIQNYLMFNHSFTFQTVYNVGNKIFFMKNNNMFLEFDLDLM